MESVCGVCAREGGSRLHRVVGGERHARRPLQRVQLIADAHEVRDHGEEDVQLPAVARLATAAARVGLVADEPQDHGGVGCTGKSRITQDEKSLRNSMFLTDVVREERPEGFLQQVEGILV